MFWDTREGRKNYKGVFWLNAASATSFQSGIQDLARVLKVVDETQLSATKPEEIRDMVLHELNRSDHWLLVLDNVDEASMIVGFLPERRGTRHVLITTRQRSMSSVLKAEQIDLNPMEEDEAISLFKKTANPGHARHSKGEYVELVNALGFLPLAIVQAAAYLSETQDDISNYSRFYKSSRKNIWGWKPFHDSSYVTVATVMAISFGKVKESEVSVRLFCLLSFLDPANVPETLLTTSDKFQDTVLRSAFGDPANVNSALQPLLVYNFVQRSGGNISMHRLVQNVMRDLIERDLQDQANVLEILQDFDRVPEYWVQRAIEIISIAYPPSSPETWNHCKLYNSHANCCITYGNKYAPDSEMLADLEVVVGNYAYDQGEYSQSRELFQSALGKYEQICGEDHTKMGDGLRGLGRSLAELGEHKQAIHQFERARNLNDIVLAKDPIASAGVISELGRSLYHMGKYNEAIQTFEKALQIVEGASNQLESARLLGLIGAVLLSKKQFVKARRKCERALEIHEQVLGRDHIDSAGLVCLLSAIQHRKGHYRKALRQYERALKIQQNTFGKDHIKSVDTIDSIGLSLLFLGKCHQALEKFEQELVITENAFGKGHIKTENAVFNIAASKLFSGKHQEALGMYERAMDIYGAKLCEEHGEEGSLFNESANGRWHVQNQGAIRSTTLRNPGRRKSQSVGTKPSRQL